MWGAKRSKMYDNGNSDESEEYEYDSEDIDETLIINRMQKALINVVKNGYSEFAVSGILSDAPIHAIVVKQNQKIIRFPLFEDDLPSIIDAFEQSPYGKGTETIIDTSFRNSWHLDPDDFVILNPKWDDYLNDIVVPRIRHEMAITTSFKATLYKLLLYKSGSFFKPHRDTEKEERMFATLVIQLPTRFNGGELVIEHDNKTKKIDFGSTVELGNDFGTFFTAFYCDCKHEILPVSDGIRVCLVYNLVMLETDPSHVPTAPIVSGIETKIVSICDDWRKTNSPTQIVYGLSHKYTERSISLLSLKSTDRAVADALVKLSKDHSLAVYLGTLEKTWIGGEDDLRNNSDDSDEDNFSYSCHHKVKYHLKNLELIGTPNADTPELRSVSVDYDSELIPKDCFQGFEPFDQQEEETGNEGTVLTLSYRHSAILLFPIENIFKVLIEQGQSDEAKRMFLDECKKFESDSRCADTKTKLLEWGHLMIPKFPWWHRKTISSSLLSAISTLNDLPLLQKFLANHILNEESVEQIVQQCDKIGWNVLSEHLVTSFKRLKSEEALKILSSLVGNPADFVGKDEKKIFCFTLMDLIPELNSYNYRYPSAELLYTFCDLAKQMNYDPQSYLKAQRAEIIVTVLVKLASKTNNVLDQFWRDVAQYFLDEMKRLDTSPNQKPVWIREDAVSCACKDCEALSRFMKKDEKSTEFRIGENRLHLENIVGGMDKLTFTTHDSSVWQPARMVVTKTEPSSYTASAEQIVARDLITKLIPILQ